MNENTLAETLAEESARVPGEPANGLHPTAPARPPSPNEIVVVGGSGSARGLRPVAGGEEAKWNGNEDSLRKRCELTDRDIRIFIFLELFGAGTLGQLWSRFFNPGWQRQEGMDYLFLKRIPVPKGIFSRAHRRLKKLADYGYLERRRWNGHIVFTLSPAGHWQLVKRTLNRLGKHWKNGAREHEMTHTLLLGAFFFVLRSLNFRVKSEREIRRDAWLEARKAKGRYRPKEAIPDLYFGSAARTVGFELELSLKSQARYVEYWKILGRSRGIEEPQWLYIAGTPAIKKHLLETAQHEYARGLFFCDLENFIGNAEQAIFTNHSGWYFKLRDLHNESFHLEGVPRDIREAWERQDRRREENPW